MSQMLLKGAQVTGKRSFMSGKGKMCYMVELTFFGGNASVFLEGDQFAKCQAIEGEHYDVVADLKYTGGKFEITGLPEFHADDSCKIVTPITVAAAAAARKQAAESRLGEPGPGETAVPGATVPGRRAA